MADPAKPPYDPFIPAGGAQEQPGSQKTAVLQAVSFDLSSRD